MNVFMGVLYSTHSREMYAQTKGNWTPRNSHYFVRFLPKRERILIPKYGWGIKEEATVSNHRLVNIVSIKSKWVERVQKGALSRYFWANKTISKAKMSWGKKLLHGKNMNLQSGHFRRSFVISPLFWYFISLCTLEVLHILPSQGSMLEFFP